MALKVTPEGANFRCEIRSENAYTDLNFLCSMIEDYFDTSFESLVVDLTHHEHLDSASLGKLLKMHTVLANADRKIEIVCGQKIYDILRSFYLEEKLNARAVW